MRVCASVCPPLAGHKGRVLYVCDTSVSSGTCVEHGRVMPLFKVMLVDTQRKATVIAFEHSFPILLPY